MNWGALANLIPLFTNAMSALGAAKSSEQKGAIDQAYANRLQSDAQQNALGTSVAAQTALANSLASYNPMKEQAYAGLMTTLPRLRAAEGSQARQYEANIEGIDNLRAANAQAFSPENLAKREQLFNTAQQGLLSSAQMGQQMAQQAANNTINTNPGPGALGYISAFAPMIPGVIGAFKQPGAAPTGTPTPSTSQRPWERPLFGNGLQPIGSSPSQAPANAVQLALQQALGPAQPQQSLSQRPWKKPLFGG